MRFRAPSSTHALIGRCVRSRSDYYVKDNQQYLAKNPFGYRCHADTGVAFPR